MPPEALDHLRRHRLLAVIRAASADQAVASARAVARGGLPVVEVTFTVPDAPRAIAALAREPGLVVGAGTVLTVADADAALAAGARFIVAPNGHREVGARALAAGVLWCPGAYTTSEIIAVREAGAQLVKVYPVGVAGGPAYIRVIRDPLPHVPMLAAGGTSLENVVPFLEAGCVACGLGGALADPALAAAGAFDEIERRARSFVERVQAYAAPQPAGRAAATT